MKIKQITRAFLFLIIALAFTSCDKDMKDVYVLAPENLSVGGASQDIILDQDYLNGLALTLYWDDNGRISTSDKRVQAPYNAYSNYIQMSATEDFSHVVEFTTEEGVFERQFTCGELNNAVSNLDFEGGVKRKLYIRIKSVVGPNISPLFSNILEVNVTPYVIDMTVGFVLNSAGEESGMQLSNSDEIGIYSGFVGAGAWYGWWLKEGNGTRWGNVGADGHTFEISSEPSAWNFWFPGQSGCYYTVVDIPAGEWKALWIPSLTVSGDITGDMTYDRTSNTWSLTFDNATVGTKTITISGIGRQYDKSTGTDDALAIDTPVGFSGNADALSFTKGEISVGAATTGEHTLKLNLSNPKELKASIESSSAPAPVTIAKHLYMIGVDDGFPDADGWNFNHYLTLGGQDEMEKQYGGLCDINSAWGYKFAVEENNWDDVYTMVSGGTALAGNLEHNGSNNIEKPSPGIYMVYADLSLLTYKLTAVETVSYAGFNDDWNPQPMSRTSDTGCVYTADIELKSNTPWGFKIIINGSWDSNMVFGSNAGELKPFVDGTTTDGEFEPGKYTLTVDFNTYRYTLTAK